MISPTFRCAIFVFALLATRSLSQEEKGEPRFLPLSPAELLKFVPNAPANWKITSSIASNQVNSWLLTIAQRSIEYTPSNNQNVQGAPTMKTSIILMDSGGQQMSAGHFDNFRPGLSGNRENAVINGCPTLITRESPIRERAIMNVNNRFMLTLVAENQPLGSAKNWAATLDVRKLAEAGRASPLMARVPTEVKIELVDELNPKNNRQSVQAVKTESR
jgi:hypothetical protein